MGLNKHSENQSFEEMAIEQAQQETPEGEVSTPETTEEGDVETQKTE